MDLDASVGLRVCAGDAEHVRAELESRPESPEVHLALGMVDFMEARFDDARAHLEASYLSFQREGRHRRAAVAAAHLARLAAAGVGNTVVAAGWVGRALRILGDDDCVERGWVALNQLACSLPNIENLDRDARLALDLARRFGDTDLECQALADSGLALVSRGLLDEGMGRVDEALTMALSGECDNLVVISQVQCSFISACDRAGDLPRMEGWLAVLLDDPTVPAVLSNHCRTALGSLLCLAGRWPEADAQLRASVGDSRHANQIADARCSLADLRLQQGRLADAARVLAGLESTPAAQPVLAQLHYARGDHDLAVATVQSALPDHAGDVLRGVRLHALLVDAELARGHLPGAQRALAVMRDAVGHSSSPPVRARLGLAEARVALAEGQGVDAMRRVARVLGELGQGWPLLGAECRLALATALAGTDRVAAITEARRTLAGLGAIDSPLRARAQTLLHELGVVEDGVLPDAPARLSAREREVLGLLGEGLSNPEIARRLVISPRTAEHHVGAVLRKLQLRSRSEAAVYAATMTSRPG